MTFTLVWLGASLVFSLIFWNRPAVVLAAIIAAHVLIPTMGEGVFMPVLHPAHYLLLVHILVQAVFAWPRVRRAIFTRPALWGLVLLVLLWMLADGLSPYGGGLLGPVPTMFKLVALPFLLFLLIRDEVSHRPASERVLLWTALALGLFQVILGVQQMETGRALVYEDLYARQWWWNVDVFRALGTTGHGIQMGAFLASLVLLTLRLRSVWLRLALILAFIYGILLAEARLALIFALVGAVLVALVSLLQKPLRTLTALGTAVLLIAPTFLVSEAFQRTVMKFQDDQGSNEKRYAAFAWAGQHFESFLWVGFPGERDLRGGGLVQSSLENGYLMFGLHFGLIAAVLLALVHVGLFIRPLVSAGHGWGVRVPFALAAIVSLGVYFGSSSFMAQALEGHTLFIFAGLAWVGYMDAATVRRDPEESGQDMGGRVLSAVRS